MGWYHNKDVPVPLNSSGSLLLSKQEAFIVTNPLSLAARRALHGTRSKQGETFLSSTRGPKVFEGFKPLKLSSRA